MLEVEMKFPLADFAQLERQLAECGAHASNTREDIDQYFNAPDRDFARTDEALRIRRVGQTNFVTYKGPKRDPHTKTRTEIEVPLAGGDDMAAKFAALLVSLGYRPVATVHKRRRLFHVKRDGFSLEICLDDVTGLGRFAEIEIMAPEERLAEARATLMHMAAEWGLGQSERRSYLELLLATQGRR
jgi:adenylate cyclase class 2